jgi:hypothetical protein
MADQETQPKFEAHLHRGGTGVPEMLRMLQAYSEHEDIEKLKEQVYKENLLGKTSTDMENNLFYAFRLRFTRSNDLPPTNLIARIICRPISDAAKIQLLFPYFLAADPMATNFYQYLAQAQLSSIRPSLQTSDVYNYFEKAAQSHPEIAKWTIGVQRRWCQGFVFFLRQFRILEPRPGSTLHRLWLLPEPFAFYWLWFWYQGESFYQASQNPWWQLLQVDKSAMNDLLSDGQLKKWWLIQRAGDIVQFQPQFRSLKEWIDHGLV